MPKEGVTYYLPILVPEPRGTIVKFYFDVGTWEGGGLGYWSGLRYSNESLVLKYRVGYWGICYLRSILV